MPGREKSFQGQLDELNAVPVVLSIDIHSLFPWLPHTRTRALKPWKESACLFLFHMTNCRAVVEKVLTRPLADGFTPFFTQAAPKVEQLVVERV